NDGARPCGERYHKVTKAYHEVIYTLGRMAAMTLRAVDYRALADLRYQIRRFLRVREVAARTAGVEPQQYLVLLQIKGLEGHEVATMSVLAERLQIRHHAVVQLIDRLVRAGMVERRRDGRARREVVVRLRPSRRVVLRRRRWPPISGVARGRPVRGRLPANSSVFGTSSTSISISTSMRSAPATPRSSTRMRDGSAPTRMLRC